MFTKLTSTFSAPPPCKSWIKLNEIGDSIKVSGIICPPGEGYASSQEIYIFLNRRPIANTFLLGALRECYRSYLPAKTYPSAFLFIEIPESDVDINVHPTKREVRFKYETKLRYFISNCIRKNLENIQEDDLRSDYVQSCMPTESDVHDCKCPNCGCKDKKSTIGV